MIITKGTKVYDDENNEYIIVNLIGDGGFSRIYRIIKEKDKKEYALKTFSSDFENKSELETFRNEINKALEIDCENVVKYYYFNDGISHPELPPYIIMEYCNNGNLKEFLEKVKENKNELSNEEMNNIFNQIINGITKINEKVIHRDIKLENILLNDSTIKISDFGISKNIDEKTRTITFKGAGTAPYAAPEVWIGTKNTIQMDIYSMGIVFYQIATLLEYPYDVVNNEYENAHLYQVPNKISTYNDKISLGVQTTILKMLEKEPSKRFDNWEEVKIALNNSVKTQPSKNVQMMLTKRMEIDEILRKNRIEETKRIEYIKKQKQNVSYSIFNNIYNPLKEFVEEFNSSYAPGDIKISDYIVGDNKINEFRVDTMSRKSLRVIINNIIEDTFKREQKDAFFDEIYEKEYRPNINGKEILAWGAIYFDHVKSYNLILVKDSNIYGKWYQLKNSLSPFNNTEERTNPFAFDFNEIEEQIKYINVTHIYSSKLEDFDIDELIKNISEII